MSKSNRIKNMVKLGKDGHVPQPFSHSVRTELTQNDESMELPATQNQSDTFVDTLRRTKASDYMALGMKIPINNDAGIPVQFNEEIATVRDINAGSPSLLNNVDSMDIIYTQIATTSPVTDIRSLDVSTNQSFAEKENNLPISENQHTDDNMDFSPDDSNDEYQPPQQIRIRNRIFSTSSSNSTQIQSPISKKGRKRIKNQQKWKKNIARELKNSGKEYLSRSGKKIEKKVMKPPCNCRLQCRNKFTENQRKQIFESYWELASFQRQRDFLCSCIEPLNISCRRLKNVENPRTPNCSFKLLNNGQS